MLLAKAICSTGEICWQRRMSGERSCYTLEETHLDWYEARQDCISKGGHLVSYETYEEMEFVARNILYEIGELLMALASSHYCINCLLFHNFSTFKKQHNNCAKF